ncbi:MAG: RNA polymerase sigma factor FliA [Xanthomonadales bacterium]|jgi:RNA polymerase sigma factor for flagellar operon FliA|nr:RNA polymerase sigma factor FliA [Xanthomonadales bacterium]
MNAAASYAYYEQTGSQDLVTRHAGLVRRIALHLVARLPDSVELDDLIQAGMLGLLEAASSFDATQGASFETFAGIRIRGSMIDELRRGDWAPRSVHRKMREVTRTIQAIEQETGSEAGEQQVAERMGITLDEYRHITLDASQCQLLSLTPADPDEDGHSREVASGDAQPTDVLQKAQFQRDLADAIKQLPEREQLVMSLYYDEAMNLREIGAVLGVSESRVCQIHGQAMVRLRARLGDWIDRGK